VLDEVERQLGVAGGRNGRSSGSGS
jgi:hypothetical protein